MAEVVDIEEFKARKLKRLEDEWVSYMDRASKFQDQGKHKFANEMIAKAKVLRTEIDKLRKPKAKREPYLKYGNHDHKMDVFTYGHVDMGHRKEISPEPENN